MKIRDAAGMVDQNMWMFGCDQLVKYECALYMCLFYLHSKQSRLRHAKTLPQCMCKYLGMSKGTD